MSARGVPASAATRPEAAAASPRPRPRIAVVDYGAGNLVSIDQALRAVGADVVLAHRPEGLAGADALIVPGVGAAAPAMNRLRRRRLLDPILAWLAEDRPFLGICLGLQLLFDASDEDGARTFGIIPGRTTLLRDAPRLPHIGWNQVELRRAHPLFDGIPSGSNFYFVHSYAGAPEGPMAAAMTLAETEHGGRFVSAVAHGNLAGVQFHPERSGPDGLRLLGNFVRSLTAAGAPTRTQPAPRRSTRTASTAGRAASSGKAASSGRATAAAAAAARTAAARPAAAGPRTA